MNEVLSGGTMIRVSLFLRGGLEDYSVIVPHSSPGSSYL